MAEYEYVIISNDVLISAFLPLISIIGHLLKLNHAMSKTILLYLFSFPFPDYLLDWQDNFNINHLQILVFMNYLSS